MFARPISIRLLALLVLMAICTQMAVCMSEDYRGGDATGPSAPIGSDCSCHDCGCCSLHTGFPPRAETFIANLIERLPESPAPRSTEKPRPRLDRPPRS